MGPHDVWDDSNIKNWFKLLTDGNQALLDSWQASVIKGNAGELATLAGTTEVKFSVAFCLQIHSQFRRSDRKVSIVWVRVSRILQHL